ncbi:MAG TPA: hypothetical protein VE617_03915 [Propionibacteriaceae bacterium]|nr:hypothetical protein [Propionibacteriaceae bacterium]
MSQTGQIIAWFAFFGLVLVARLLLTRPARRVLGPHVRRLADWALEHLNRPEELDPEDEELMIIRRRQRLEAHIERLRRILATDQTMSATRQAGNRLAYAWLQRELERTPLLVPTMVPTRSVSLVDYDSRRGSSVEILEVGGWR